MKTKSAWKAKGLGGVLYHERAGVEAPGAAFTPQIKVEKDNSSTTTTPNLTFTPSPSHPHFKNHSLL